MGLERHPLEVIDGGLRLPLVERQESEPVGGILFHLLVEPLGGIGLRRRHPDEGFGDLLVARPGEQIDRLGAIRSIQFPAKLAQPCGIERTDQSAAAGGAIGLRQRDPHDCQFLVESRLDHSRTGAAPLLHQPGKFPQPDTLRGATLGGALSNRQRGEGPRSHGTGIDRHIDPVCAREGAVEHVHAAGKAPFSGRHQNGEAGDISRLNRIGPIG